MRRVEAKRDSMIRTKHDSINNSTKETVTSQDRDGETLVIATKVSVLGSRYPGIVCALILGSAQDVVCCLRQAFRY
jgi:hypothetical protein